MSTVLDEARIVDARQVQVLRWVGVSAVAFLTFDVLINIADEVELIWSVPRTWANWVYLYIRYFAVIELTSLLILGTNERNHLGFTSQACRGWIIYEAFVSISLAFFMEAVLSIRIYAIYERNKSLLLLLSLLLAAELVMAIVGTALSVAEAEFSLELGCVVISTPPIYMAAWIAPLSVQTILVILTMFKCIPAIAKKTDRECIFFAFATDGVWAYALMFAVLLLNLLLFTLKTSPLAPLCFKWSLCATSFCGSHIILNMRRLHARIRPLTVLSSHRITQDEEFALTTCSMGQFEGSTDSIPNPTSGSGDIHRTQIQ